MPACSDPRTDRDAPDVPRDRFLETAVRERVVGGRLYDAHIAEVARSAGAGTVVTENRRHFTGLVRHGIRIVAAAELLADAGLAP